MPRTSSSPEGAIQCRNLWPVPICSSFSSRVEEYADAKTRRHGARRSFSEMHVGFRRAMQWPHSAACLKTPRPDGLRRRPGSAREGQAGARGRVHEPGRRLRPLQAGMQKCKSARRAPTSPLSANRPQSRSSRFELRTSHPTIPAGGIAFHEYFRRLRAIQSFTASGPNQRRCPSAGVPSWGG